MSHVKPLLRATGLPAALLPAALLPVTWLCTAFAAPAAGAIRHEPLTYRHGDVTFRGDLVYDDALKGL